VFEHAHEDGGLAAEAKVQLPSGSGPGELQGHLHKSELMQNIAQSFSALEESEKRHTEAIMLEEEHSRKRYISQFQSLARKIDIQAGLKSKADLAAVASDTQALEARIQRAEHAMATKADVTEVKEKQNKDLSIYATNEGVAQALATAINTMSEAQSEARDKAAEVFGGSGLSASGGASRFLDIK